MQSLEKSVRICESTRLDIWCRDGSRWTSIHAHNRTIRPFIFRPTCLSHGFQTQLRNRVDCWCGAGVPEELLYVVSRNMTSMVEQLEFRLTYIYDDSEILRLDGE